MVIWDFITQKDSRILRSVRLLGGMPVKKRENSAKAKKHYLQKTLNTISVRGNAPLVGYVSLLALYFIAYYLTRKFAGMQGGIPIGENGMLPYSMFTGETIVQ